ncbi:MAG: pyruvate dehydrogenase (acetyl-transferring), homodimeric type [Gammaproteobacteria bacterium]
MAQPDNADLKQVTDLDPQETQEWVESLDAVLHQEGVERAHFLLEKLIDKARRSGAYLPYSAETAYLNTIPPDKEEKSPGDPAMEWRLRSLVRWNAMAMVVQANRKNGELGGHIASFASAATLYDVAFNHFFHAPTDDHGGDLAFIQGHSAPGIYARSYLYGRFSEQQLLNFRQDVGGNGLSSYPHPWLMPDYWQFPTVSMGLGPIMAIYQARFMRYMQNRGLSDNAKRKVWAFMGDGEMDEPESRGAIGLAVREKLDNLIFVINCNLQRLDGPVRGNGKIIQELEGEFRGAGWNVIKVIWGSYWDQLIAQDTSGMLLKRMEEVVDGEYQSYATRGGDYARKHFFGKYPETAALVANMTDEDINRLNRGGHDPHKVYAAYAAAMKHKGQPTLILVKTVKGYGMGDSGEGMNITHQQKKMGEDSLKEFRDRFNLPISDEDINDIPFFKPPEDSPEIKYLKEHREALGGDFFKPKTKAPALTIPDLNVFDALLKGSGERAMSTTMAFVRILNILMKDKNIGERIVPIIADEARTFGMEGMFRQYGIYSSVGQLYEPQDRDQVMYYREDIKGQVIEDGLNEAGAMSSWIAAATAYRHHSTAMIPFYTYYSMFGFQRVGDLIYAAADSRARGFLMGGTAGRTTLAGEGLQHQDGQSHLQASMIPNCISYDPTFAYELAIIITDGLKRMYVDQEDIFYYLTIMNENYQQPAMPEGVEAGVLKGLYLYKESDQKEALLKVQLLGAGTILNEVIAAAEMLENDHGIAADIWSATSFTELRREGLDCKRWNRLHPEETPRISYVEQCLSDRKGPFIASTDYMKLQADQIREFVPGFYNVLGTDGFGRSDDRKQLRSFFEVDRYHVAIAALESLAQEELIPAETVTEAIKKYGIDQNKPNPVTV